MTFVDRTFVGEACDFLLYIPHTQFDSLPGGCFFLSLRATASCSVSSLSFSPSNFCKAGSKAHTMVKEYVMMYTEHCSIAVGDTMTMTMTMTHSEKSNICQMKAWPYRQECRGHDTTVLFQFLLLLEDLSLDSAFFGQHTVCTCAHHSCD